MSGRLIEEGLIDQTDDGRYKITMKGLDMIKNLESVHNVFQKQFEVLLRVGSRGRFMTLDLLDRITNIGSALSSNLDKMTEQERNRYRHFFVHLSIVINDINLYILLSLVPELMPPLAVFGTISKSK
jgi:hypothetical protein